MAQTLTCERLFHRRRFLIRRLISTFRESARNPFPNWGSSLESVDLSAVKYDESLWDRIGKPIISRTPPRNACFRFSREALHCGTATTFTPFVSSRCRTSGDATAVSGTVSLPLARLIERL